MRGRGVGVSPRRQKASDEKQYVNRDDVLRPTVCTEGVTTRCQLSDDDIVRLTALGMTTLEVTHDLGNLLQVAGSAVRLIDRHITGTSHESLRPIVDAAVASVERAMLLCHRVLRAAHARPTAREPVQADLLVADMHDAIVCAIGPAIDLIVQSDGDIPGIACHHADLENAVLNLAINARDAMRGVGTLTVRIGREPSMSPSTARENVILSVTDTGCGMSHEVADRIFQPFFTTKPRDQGTGLGLAMVATFVKKLGGTVKVASVIGEGTTFTLQVPCAEVEQTGSASTGDYQPEGISDVDR